MEIGTREEISEKEKESIVHTAGDMSEPDEIDEGLVTIDGKAYRKTRYTVDYGPKIGTTRVTVYDPCITEEAQQRRREAIVRKCEELIRKGLM